MGSNVSKTIRKGIASTSCFEDNPGLLIYGMTCVIISVGIWLLLASYLELPVSTTHSCVGGIVGMRAAASAETRVAGACFLGARRASAFSGRPP